MNPELFDSLFPGLFDSLEMERLVRAWRDQVYERPSSDKNWEGCREGWMKPENIQWLKEQARKAT